MSGRFMLFETDKVLVDVDAILTVRALPEARRYSTSVELVGGSFVELETEFDEVVDAIATVVGAL